MGRYGYVRKWSTVITISTFDGNAVTTFPDDIDLKTIDIPNGSYIADRNGERFYVGVFTVGNFETKTKVVTVERIIMGPVVKFARHHSRAITKGAIAVLLGDAGLRYCRVVTHKGVKATARSSILRDYSIDRLSPKMREWAILRILEG